MKKVDVSSTQLETVLNILKKNLPPNTTVWVFGSRAGKTKKAFSDLDLAIDATAPLLYSTLVNLKNDFEESDLPYKVDVVDWHLIDAAFQARIKAYRNITQLFP